MRLTKEIVNITRFIEVNFQIIGKLMKQYKEILKDLNMNHKDFIFEINQIIANSFVYQNIHFLPKLLDQLEQIYLEKFYQSIDSGAGKDRFKKIYQVKQFITEEAVYLGIFTGFFFTCFISIIILMLKEHANYKEHKFLIDREFPIFKGNFLLILYLFSLGLNVYYWEQYNINYKRVFKIQKTDINAFKIIQLSAIFACIWAVNLIYCLISHLHFQTKLNFFQRNLQIYCAPISMMIFMFYFIFPNTKSVINLKLQETIRSILMSPFNQLSFFIPWATDQIESLIIPIKDITYTMTYIYYLLLNKDFMMLDFHHFVSFQMVCVYLYLLLRFIQCIKKAQIKKQRLKYLKYAFKYVLVGLTCLTGFFNDSTKGKQLWIMMILASTFYEFFWDLHVDWGFFQKQNKNYLLRKQLYYPHKRFYYCGMIANLFLRFNHVLSLQPYLLQKNFFEQHIKLLIGFLEMVRRFVWNLFKVELRNIDFEGDYATIDGFKLPFDINIKQEDKELMNFINKFMINHLILSKINNDEFLINENFQIRNAQNYIENYYTKEQNDVNNELIQQINQSVSTNQLNDFYKEYKKIIHEINERLNEQEKIKDKSAPNSVSIINERVHQNTLISGIISKVNKKIDTPKNSLQFTPKAQIIDQDFFIDNFSQQFSDYYHQPQLIHFKSENKSLIQNQNKNKIGTFNTFLQDVRDYQKQEQNLGMQKISSEELKQKTNLQQVNEIIPQIIEQKSFEKNSKKQYHTFSVPEYKRKKDQKRFRFIWI